jgi:pimeloyl-ACP methyl ester carboxylesterase
MRTTPRRRLPFALSVVCVLAAPFGGPAEERLVSIGARHLAIDCTGEHSASSTVVLIAGQGRTAKDWSKVQPAVSSFALVCSYDRAGLGNSDKTAQPQSVDEIIGDLDTLLAAAGEKPPYLLVAHSIAGIPARRFTARFRGEVAGLVFIESSHEEQIWRLHEVAPNGPSPVADPAGFWIRAGQRLEWRTDLPLIVLMQGAPPSRISGMTEEQSMAFARIWRELQQDLAGRSPKGEFRVAEKSGHFVQLDQPDLVIQAIRDLLGKP